MDAKNFQIIEERWMSLNVEEKEFIFEFLKVCYPEKVSLLKEARWWNTVGDILGIFDPTGVIDLINGLDYIRQGDYFFGFLSMVSVIPYVGDTVAKPIMFLGKGSKLMRGVNEALKLSKAGKTAEAAKILQDAGSASGMIAKLIKTSGRWALKLKSAINAIPGGKLTGGMRSVLNGWIDLFISAGKRSSNVRSLTRVAGRKLATQAGTISAKDAAKMIKTLRSTIKTESKIFKNFKASNPSFMAKYFWPGATVGILWRNRDLTSLVRRTKWYAAFLDYLGLGNWVGPEELEKQMPEGELNKKFQEYVSSKEGQKNWSDEFGGTEQEDLFGQAFGGKTQPKPSAPSGGSSDPFMNTIMSIFGGAKNVTSML